MISRFAITGLPRCRSGWLANFFCFGSSLCFHDGLQFGTSFWDKLEAIAADDSSIRHIGNSDTGIPLLCDPQDFREMPVLVVVRDSKESLEDYLKYFRVYPYNDLGTPDASKLVEVFERLKTKLTHFCSLPRAKVIQADDLDNEAVVRDVWHHLVPDEPFNLPRWQVLDKLRVNPASEKVRMAWA